MKIVPAYYQDGSSRPVDTVNPLLGKREEAILRYIVMAAKAHNHVSTYDLYKVQHIFFPVDFGIERIRQYIGMLKAVGWLAYRKGQNGWCPLKPTMAAICYLQQIDHLRDMETSLPE